MIKQTIFAALLIASPLALACSGEKSQHKHKATPCAEGLCPHAKTSWSATLKLDGDKAKQIDALQESYAKKRAALKEQHQQAWKTLKEEKRKTLSNVLSKDELAQLTSHKNSKCNHHKKAQEKKCDGHKKGNVLTD